MTSNADKALLPNGLHDALPPDAEVEAWTTDHIIQVFAAHGYERVKPPLVEFEESLLADSGAATARQIFRLMDPVTERMMGVRADMTVQVARIASTRLAKAERPLRLCYAGQVLRVSGSQLRPERQFGQAGAELIGADCPEADGEVITIAAEALSAVGIDGLSVDLGLPVLVPKICDMLDLSPETRHALRQALDRKDAASVTAMGGPVAEYFGSLLSLTGAAEEALPRLEQMKLGDAVADDLRDFMRTARLIRTWLPDLKITVDLVENRGYEYHTGITYTFFSARARGELGRGGRYVTGNGPGQEGPNQGEPGKGEPAAGLSLFLDTVLQAARRPSGAKRIFLPAGTPREVGRTLRDQGWRTIDALAVDSDPAAEAARLGCTHFHTKDGPVAVNDQ